MPKAKYNPNGYKPISADDLKRLRANDRWRNAVVITGVANAALLPLAGYSAFFAPDPTEAVESSAPHNCEMPSLHESVADTKRAAENCLADRYGRVALVGYGTPSLDLTIAASESERILADGTDDLIKVDIVPISASKEALDRMHERNPNGCIENNMPSSVPSNIAKETMKLDSYDAVVAVVSMPPCDGEIAGEAYVKQQYASAYNIKEVHMRGQNFLPETHDPADVIAHEIGHIYNLGHASMIDASDSPDLGYSRFQSGFYPDEIQKYVVDLTSPARPLFPKEYQEYGEYSNLMGRHMGPLNLSLAQRWQLEWPERVLGTRPDRQKIVNGSTVVIEHTLDVDRDFAALMLDKPVKFTIKTDKNSTDIVTFDKLVIEPLDKNTNIATLYFATSHDVHILDLGIVNLGTTEPHAQTIKVGNQVVRIENTADEGLRIIDVTPAHR